MVEWRHGACIMGEIRGEWKRDEVNVYGRGEWSLVHYTEVRYDGEQDGQTYVDACIRTMMCAS